MHIMKRKMLNILIYTNVSLEIDNKSLQLFEVFAYSYIFITSFGKYYPLQSQESTFSTKIIEGR